MHIVSLQLLHAWRDATSFHRVSMHLPFISKCRKVLIMIWQSCKPIHMNISLVTYLCMAWFAIWPWSFNLRSVSIWEKHLYWVAIATFFEEFLSGELIQICCTRSVEYPYSLTIFHGNVGKQQNHHISLCRVLS